ncbi:CAP domain-containing protein [Actinoplanes sp. CA-252034]|uniref:CAP domain-containing protein n=1 Tax=Actinoplanes sp. CA-252034 TaxID=3239906 RepID=UPI003D9543A7
MFRRLALAAIAPAAAVMFLATPAQAATPVTTLQADIAKLTNVQRKSHGCGAATVNTNIVKAARAHSVWMAKTGTFSHTGSGGSNFSARVKAAGYKKPGGENIAWGYRSANEVVQAWMKSPGHRANILNCKFKTVGVGAAYAANGAAYYTQDFGF